MVTKNNNKYLLSRSIKTPLGTMLAIADEKELYLLEFTDNKTLERKIKNLEKTTSLPIVPGTTNPLISIESELHSYFNGTLQEFKTPLHYVGSLFQKSVWNELQKIPCGQTRSYANIAIALNKPSAFRAVAQANSTNHIAIVIPCHRIINSNGKLGGYSGGIHRKEWLIAHEKQS